MSFHGSAIVLLLWLCASSQSVQASDPLARLRNAADIHHKWTNASKSAHGSASVTLKFSSFEIFGFEIKTTHRQLSDNILASHDVIHSSDRFSASLSSVVIGRNSRYAFKLRKPIGSKDWTVAEVTLPVPPDWLESLDPVERALLLPTKDGHAAAKELLVLSVTDLLSLEGFELAEFNESAGAITLVCRFVIVDELRRGQKYPAIAHIRLTSTRHYATESCRIEYGDATYSSIKEVANEFNESDAACAQVRRASISIRCHEAGKLTRDDRLVFITEREGQASESDFTLSAFGLPEPYGVEWERPTPWWLYALISAGVLFVVAVIVSFWKRRLAARQAA